MYHGYVPGIVLLQVSDTGWYTTAVSTVPLRTGTQVHVLFCLLSSIKRPFL